MKIIPVLDICQGQVVHARGGLRDQYRPVRSQICADSEPCNIVQAFLDIHPFTTVYIADLDAILLGKPDKKCLKKLLGRFPGLFFWLDQGLRNKPDIINASHNRIFHVLGSETGLTGAQLSEMVYIRPQPILSLDFRNGKFLGDMSLLQHPETWPDNIILMNLDRVGTGTGHDVHLNNQIAKSIVNRNVFIAGGIRDSAELKALENTGIAGILTATALHTGRISSADIAAITCAREQKKCPG